MPQSVRSNKRSAMYGAANGAFVSVLVMAAVAMAAPSPSTFELLMPDVQPKEPDTYLCTATRVDEAHRYLTEFDPKAQSHISHHMLLYGCEEPGMAPGNVWNCGEMSSSSSPSPNARVCQTGNSILYAWAMDAPDLHLPPGVGFDVGQDTPVKYLVLQVHYKNVSSFLPPENKTDNSGLIIHTSPTRTPKQAGVYLMATGGFIPKTSIEYFESACEYNDKEIVPFAYRTHAHSLGRVISGYRVRDGEWTEIGRKDPRLPEMFYNVTTPGITIQRGDILAARCTMENTKDHTVEIGNTQNDEMCNFYIMFYVENPPTPTTRTCGTPGPPYWYWKNFEDQRMINLDDVPETASLVPGTHRALVRTARRPQVAPSRVQVEAANDNRLGGETMGSSEEYLEIPGTFQEETVEQMLDEAINNMEPAELVYMIQELAREEQLEEARKQAWLERQRLRQKNMLYP